MLQEIRHNPLLWLLIIVPALFIAQNLKPGAQTLLFLLSVLAIEPLAALLSHATESVSAKTGDTVGGLLHATLGNLTELVIALAALNAGQYMLVKASIAGAIVTNTLFALGASFFLATIALLVPSTIAKVDSAATAFTNKLSAGLAVLLILTYGLGMVFSLKTHRDFFGSAAHEDSGEAPWPISLALATLAGVTVLVAVVAGLAVLVSAQIAGSAEPCCFANDRYEGTCKVIPGKGETCQSILAYLNDPMSTGKSYCRRRLGPWQPGPGGLQDGKIQYPAGRGRVHTQSPEACTGTPHY